MQISSFGVRETFTPLSKENKKLALYLLLSDSELDSVKHFTCDSRYTKLMFDCAPPFALFKKKKFKDAPIITATLKSFRVYYHSGGDNSSHYLIRDLLLHRYVSVSPINVNGGYTSVLKAA